MRISPKQFYKITIPFIISTMTQPLLSLTDTVVIGQLGSPYGISGIALSGTLINTLYWILGFLRVCTTSDSARANGIIEKKRALIMPLFLSSFFALFIIVFQRLLFYGYIAWISPESQVISEMRTYYSIVIWGAFFVLTNYVILGWLMGQKQVKSSMLMQISGNVLNIILDIFFVFSLKQGTAGVAYATLISQGLSFMLGIWLIRHQLLSSFKGVMDYSALIRYLRNSRDLVIRTACLLAHNNIFAYYGSSFGAQTLAANSIIIQCNLVISYIYDGVANGASVFSKEASKDKSNITLKSLMKLALISMLLISFAYSFVILLTDDWIWRLFTSHEGTRVIGKQFTWVVIAYPWLAGIGLTFYGLFTGLGQTTPIAHSTVMALVFSACVFTLSYGYGNTGLWMASLSFYLGRSLFLMFYLNTLYKMNGGTSYEYV